MLREELRLAIIEAEFAQDFAVAQHLLRKLFTDIPRFAVATRVGQQFNPNSRAYWR
jgi:hypothetical protein